MTTLGTYCHDFPRLAKESGYCFQLHRGRVDWTGISEVNIDDIIQNRDFQVLEQNLTHVINCNLDRDYDVKILDQNFVKLFKLAQLGVDYLSYCELYLDRCVILLQEQLQAEKEECRKLREDNQRHVERLKKTKRKTRVAEESHQCKQCGKVFLSEIYLVSHEKRRHSKLAVTEPSQPSRVELIVPEKPSVELNDKSQQTETPTNKQSQGTQTKTETNESNKENDAKIENLTKEMGDLKERLQTTEKMLKEKNEKFNLGESSQCTFPNPFFYPPMFPFLPQYFSQPPRMGYFDLNAVPQTGLPQSQVQQEEKPVEESLKEEKGKIVVELKEIVDEGQPDTKKSFVKEMEKSPISKTVVCEIKDEEKRNTVVNRPTVVKKTEDKQKNTEMEKSPISKTVVCEIKDEEKRNTIVNRPTVVKKTEDKQKNTEIEPKKNVTVGPVEESDKEPEVVTSHVPVKEIIPVISQSSARKKLKFEDLDVESVGSPEPEVRPIPLPRKPKEMFREETGSSDTIVTPFSIEDESDPVETSIEEEKPSFKEDGKKEEGRKSFFKKIVEKNSPKIREMRKSLRKSWSNLYESMGGSREDLKREGEKGRVLEGLKLRLKELGVDPEWKGIPKETLKQKMRALQQRRTLLAKDNPSYPSVRKHLEKTILKKLNKTGDKIEDRNSDSESPGRETPTPGTSQRKDSPKEKNKEEIRTNNKTDKEETALSSEEDKPEENQPKYVMYDLESDTESEISVKEIPEKLNTTNKFLSSSKFPERIQEVVRIEPVPEKNDRKGEKKVDLTIFQVDAKKNEKNLVLNTMDELQTDSEFEDEFLKEFEENSLKSIGGILEKNVETDDIPKLGKLESQSILKSALFGQHKSQMGVKKKVIFADKEPTPGNKKPAEPSAKQKTGDDWSSDSDWDVAA